MQRVLLAAGATGCRLSRAGGDCVAVQAGLGRPGRRRRLPAHNITAADVACTAPKGAALRLGPQLQGGCVRIHIGGFYMLAQCNL